MVVCCIILCKQYQCRLYAEYLYICDRYHAINSLKQRNRQGLTLPYVYISRKSETVTNDNKFRIILWWWRWRYRSARFRARRHAAPKNSPPDCFLYGCFDYIPLQKYKSTARERLRKEVSPFGFCNRLG